MMTPTADTAWSVLLPAGTVWRPGGGASPRGAPPGDSPGAPPGAGSIAAPAGPWAVLGPARPGSAGPAGPAGCPRTYIAVPSRRRPLIVASCDPAVLRYLADSVLTVPPGTGPVLSLLLTAGLRLLRRRGTWVLAALLGAARVVVVGAAR